MVSAILFFFILFGLFAYALAMRIRDHRSGLAPEVIQQRMKKRLPWVMGIFFGACVMVMLTDR
jgi:hypothetical protein